MNKLVCIFTFSLGAAAGSLVTWKIVKTKYEQIAQEEIDSVKDAFSRKNTALTNEVEKAHACLKANSENNKVPGFYDSMVEDLGYSAAEEKKEKGEAVKDNKIYVISPDEFSDRGDYKVESLTYYQDKVLTYDNGEIIENVDEIVGSDSLEHFGEYEDDSVFVRNEKMKTDFEILLDERCYSNAISKKIHSVEDYE